MVIDFHTHAFPDSLAQKAIPLLSKKSGNMIPFTDGTANDLLRRMDEYGVDISVVLNIATNERQMENVNNFAISLNSDRLISFGSFHPDAVTAVDEIKRLKNAGIKGVKLHPDYQGFFVDDEKMLPFYNLLSELDMITVFHAGADIGYAAPFHCTPSRLKRALPHFGGAPVIAAHMGGYIMWDEVEKHLCGTDIYLDTSFSYSRIPTMQAKRMIKNHGAERFVFGSDMPWSAQGNEMLFIKALELDEIDEQLILSGNAKRLLRLK